MSKRKGSAEKLFKPDAKPVVGLGLNDVGMDLQAQIEEGKKLDHNFAVATWGKFSEERYRQAREIVEGWAAAPAKEDIARQWPIKAPMLQKQLARLSEVTAKYVRESVLKRDAEAFRKIADLLEQLHLAASPRAAAILFHVQTARVLNRDHQFTFFEIRDAVAELEEIMPPFEEKFEKNLRRLISKLGIPLAKGQ